MRGHDVMDFARQGDVLDRNLLFSPVLSKTTANLFSGTAIEQACKSLDIAAMADFAQPVISADWPADEPAVAVDRWLAITCLRRGYHLVPSRGLDQFAAIQGHHEQAEVAGARVDTAPRWLASMIAYSATSCPSVFQHRFLRC